MAALLIALHLAAVQGSRGDNRLVDKCRRQWLSIALAATCASHRKALRRRSSHGELPSRHNPYYKYCCTSPLSHPGAPVTFRFA
ncbi:hypothetical protein EAG_09428 [Camponotus floridanus]|uniref:Secreted protein n=1 Tax=Camponotus floridanus TaxID=104421 RepID=E1ZV50_CAMFO|nr:hypothetical protein EAG_09428 [Camponotus floridanus]